ncbi:MAG: indolepyruvate oxidoreductase subunit beta family protein [Gammaproteobacteria bacterium]
MSDLVNPERPIKLTIAALGGQGGGVLATWLVQVAEAEGYLAQSTSLPGVAQRTGATIYYLEFFSRAAAERAGCEPVMAMMPVCGDVDCVVAAELAEAGRALQRGLVTPDRTTLIASSHRTYTISEKSAMGRAIADADQLAELARSQSKRLIMFDMDSVAQEHRSVISSVLLGAICGGNVLPFRQEAFEAVIRSSGISVKTNLAAFSAACERARQGDAAGQERPASRPVLPEVPVRARSPELQPHLDRVRRFAPPLQPLIFEGSRRLLDYQGARYVDLYLRRLEPIAALDGRAGPDGEWTLTEATARSLALWMSFEDTIRVADLKTRPARFERVREEIRAAPDQLFGISEFMKPGVAEIAGTLPAGIGTWVLASPRICRLLERWTGGKQVRTRTIHGYFLLHSLAGLKRWRPATLRYREESARIEQWLERISQLAENHYDLAVELARAQRLVKGYGETHERGWNNFKVLLEQLDVLAARSNGAALLAQLQAAALADEDGQALERELAAIEQGPLRTVLPVRSGAAQ